MFKLYGDTFNGFQASEYGREHGYLDYATLAKGFDAVYNDEILRASDDFEVVSGDWDDEVFQWYIISSSFAEVLKEIDEHVEYSESLDMYIWGVTHWGTSWDYVLTDIPLNCGEDAFK